MVTRDLALSKQRSLTAMDAPGAAAAVFAYLLTRLAETRTGSVYGEEHDEAGAVPIYLCAKREGLFVKRHQAVPLVTYSAANFARLVDYLLRSVLAVEGSHAFAWLTVHFDGESGSRFFTVCVRRHARFGECFQIDQSSPSAGT